MTPLWYFPLGEDYVEDKDEDNLGGQRKALSPGSAGLLVSLASEHQLSILLLLISVVG